MGVDSYKKIFWALRFTGQIFFKALWIDIATIWQPVDNVIMVRWIVHGIPRVLQNGHSRFDGTSEYKLDKNGKIYQHKVDNVAMNSRKKFKILPLEELIRSLGCPSTPKPTCFEMISLMPFRLRWTWMRWYLSLDLMLAYGAKCWWISSNLIPPNFAFLIFGCVPTYQWDIPDYNRCICVQP